MSIHISAEKGAIAKTILMPGDPLRAKLIAERYLDDCRLVSQTRNVYFFTGTYQGKPLSIGASGMGCPSIGIYSYELYTEYEVENIIRIGTCGAYTADLRLYDIINVDLAASESTFAQYAWGIQEHALRFQGHAHHLINEVASGMIDRHPEYLRLQTAPVHCSDIFYRKDSDIPAIAQQYQCVAVEMETFALFANAQYLGKSAAALLTVSDVIPTHEKISAEQRETALIPMIELALADAVKL